MADSYSNAAGGKLKLKGGADIGGKIKKCVGDENHVRKTSSCTVQ